MSDSPGIPPGDDEIAAWIRHHPEVWLDAETAPADTDEQWANEIVERVLAAERRARRGRVRGLIGGGIAIAVMAGGAVGAAALLRNGQPSAPEAGTVCRAEAALDADAISLGAGKDPVAQCLQLWNGGRFAPYITDGEIPPLVACIGRGGAIEVFPGQTSTCTDLGLQPADSTLTPENALVVELEEVLVRSINAAGCVVGDDAVGTAQQAIGELGLEGWSVQIEPGAEQVCAKAAIDSTTRSVIISKV